MTLKEMSDAELFKSRDRYERLAAKLGLAGLLDKMDEALERLSEIDAEIDARDAELDAEIAAAQVRPEDYDCADPIGQSGR